MEKIDHADTNQKKSGAMDLAELYTTYLESYQEKVH
jgi:hypothetical protein